MPYNRRRRQTLCTRPRSHQNPKVRRWKRLGACGTLAATLRGLRRCHARAQDVRLPHKCRAAKRRRGRVPLPVTEARVRNASLTMFLEPAWEIRATLERYHP